MADDQKESAAKSLGRTSRRRKSLLLRIDSLNTVYGSEIKYLILFLMAY